MVRDITSSLVCREAERVKTRKFFADEIMCLALESLRQQYFGE